MRRKTQGMISPHFWYCFNIFLEMLAKFNLFVMTSRMATFAHSIIR